MSCNILVYTVLRNYERFHIFEYTHIFYICRISDVLLGYYSVPFSYSYYLVT